MGGGRPIGNFPQKFLSFLEHLGQHNHDGEYTQGDYVGSVHQSGGGFRTAGSPICANKIFICLVVPPRQTMQAVTHVVVGKILGNTIDSRYIGQKI